MLDLIEKFTPFIRGARSDEDIVEIMNQICVALGFRSSLLFACPNDDMSSVLCHLDTNKGREMGWQELAEGFCSSAATENPMFRPTFTKLTADRFGPLDGAILAFAKRADIVDCTLVHVSSGGQAVGLVGFSGPTTFSTRIELGLQLLVYALFAQTRSLTSISDDRRPTLSPREKEVITLSAGGFTSGEIAAKLSISARTVNQHVDNVAEKLGTRNRSHTVAEAIRHNLLN